MSLRNRSSPLRVNLKILPHRNRLLRENRKPFSSSRRDLVTFSGLGVSLVIEAGKLHECGWIRNASGGRLRDGNFSLPSQRDPASSARRSSGHCERLLHLLSSWSWLLSTLILVLPLVRLIHPRLDPCSARSSRTVREFVLATIQGNFPFPGRFATGFRKFSGGFVDRFRATSSHSVSGLLMVDRWTGR